MHDLISRQATIDALFGLYEYQRDIDPTEAADLVRQGIYLAEKKIEQLPSAERKGKWIDDCSCSICHWIHDDEEGFALLTNYNFCPNCGARMESEDNK